MCAPRQRLTWEVASSVYPGMVQMPAYQPAMMPQPMPMMPAVGTVPTVPGKARQGAPGSLPGKAAASFEIEAQKGLQEY